MFQKVNLFFYSLFINHQFFCLFRVNLIDISRKLLSILNYDVICSTIPNLTNDIDDNFAKKLNLFHQSLLSSVPCSLPIELLIKQIDSKHHSYSH